MNLQANAFLFSLKKVKWLFIIYFIIVCIYIFNLYENNLAIPIKYEDMLYLFGIITSKKMYFSLALFFSLAQMLLCILLAKYFNDYEKHNSPEFVYLRISLKKTLFLKFLVSFVVIFIIRSAYMYLLNMFFKQYFPISWYDNFLGIITYLGLIILIYIFEFIKVNFFKIK